MVKNEIRKRSMEAQGITPPQGPGGPVPVGGPPGIRPGPPGGPPHGYGVRPGGPPPGAPPPMHMQQHIRMQQGKFLKILVSCLKCIY